MYSQHIICSPEFNDYSLYIYVSAKLQWQVPKAQTIFLFDKIIKGLHNATVADIFKYICY